MSNATALSPKSGWTAARVERWLATKVNWIVFVSLLLGMALRLKSALGTYLNPDEVLHFVIVNQNSLADAYRASLPNAHPPLYFALLYYWRFVGSSEVMLRLPSVLASTAAAWMAYRWIGVVLGKAAAVIALVLLAFSPMLTALGAEVRGYSLLLLCMASALYFLERAFQDQKISSIVYSSLCLLLAILTHYSALWFVLAAGIYVLLRISSWKGPTRIAWMLFQLGAAATYVWLYVTHISKIRGSPMEATTITGWLRPQYFHAGESPVAFLHRGTVEVFQFLFAGRRGGSLALLLFIAGALWLLGAALLQKRGDLAAFGLLLLVPFAFGVVASLWDVYPYGGTRHSTYLVLFATAGISFLIATIVRQRLLPILLLAVLVVPSWLPHHLKDPQQIGRKEQAKELMENAIADLRTSVQPSDLVFSDYQASNLLAYYLSREHPPPAPRECGGVREVQYGAYQVVIVGSWSATADEMMTGLDGWRKGCDPAPRDSVWIFDSGGGFDLLDGLSQAAPGSISQGQRFGEAISLFQLRIDR